MKLIRDLNSFPRELRGGAVSIGNFDGVHQGHRVLVDQLRQMANQHLGPTIIFTFEPHPVRLLRPDQSPPPLTWIDRKAHLLSQLGVDVVIAYPTDLNLLEMSYRDFFDWLIVDRLGARGIVEGPNFYFGKNREGNVDRLAELCRAQDVHLQVVSPRVAGKELVSSSRIRTLIQSGGVGQARTLLTEPYRIRGIVVHGDGRGAKLGFPTANVDGVDTLIPHPGVYVGRVYQMNATYWSAIHVGPSPTFDQSRFRVEAHVLDFAQDLYGQAIEVDFVERLRDIRQFDSREELIDQMNKDVALARSVSKSFI